MTPTALTVLDISDSTAARWYGCFLETARTSVLDQISTYVVCLRHCNARTCRCFHGRLRLTNGEFRPI